MDDRKIAKKESIARKDVEVSCVLTFEESQELGKIASKLGMNNSQILKSNIQDFIKSYYSK